MKRRNIGCGIVREYGIVEVVSIMNAGGPPWRVSVNGTYDRSATIVAPTWKEAVEIGRVVEKLMMRSKRKKRK